MRRLVPIVLVLILLSFNSHAEQPERFYQRIWCDAHGGKAEVVMSDGTRCDCVTSEYAVEFDFGKKWCEGVSQALYYGALTGKRPMLVLIVQDEKEWLKYRARIVRLIEAYRLPLRVRWMEKRDG